MNCHISFSSLKSDTTNSIKLNKLSTAQSIVSFLLNRSSTFACRVDIIKIEGAQQIQILIDFSNSNSIVAAFSMTIYFTTYKPKLMVEESNRAIIAIVSPFFFYPKNFEINSTVNISYQKWNIVINHFHANSAKNIFPDNLRG